MRRQKLSISAIKNWYLMIRVARMVFYHATFLFNGWTSRQATRLKNRNSLTPSSAITVPLIHVVIFRNFILHHPGMKLLVMPNMEAPDRDLPIYSFQPWTKRGNGVPRFLLLNL